MSRSAAPRLRWLILGLVLCVAVPGIADAATGCSGAFKTLQVSEVPKFFSPYYYPPTKFDIDSNKLVVVLTPAEREALKVPRLAAAATITSEQAALLRGWLNSNAEAPLPGLLTPMVGLATSTGVGALVDLGAQWFTGSTSDARTRLLNIAGRVTANGTLEVYEQLIYEQTNPGSKSTRPEDQRLESSYVYRAVVNGTVFKDVLQLCTYELGAR